MNIPDFLLLIMSATAVIAQDPTLIPPVRPGDPMNTQRIDGGLPQETGRSDETLAPSPTTASSFDSSPLAPATRADVTGPPEWPPRSTLYGSAKKAYVTLGWTSSTNGTDYTPIWAPMTYYTSYTTYSTSERFFESCSISRYWDSVTTPCVPTFTECGGGWIRGPSTSAPCDTAETTNIFQTKYSCVTDIYYSTYGAQDPLSSIRCGMASRGFRPGYPITIYGVSPTEQPTRTAPSYSSPTHYGYRGDSSRTNPVGVIIGASMGSVAAVLVMLQILLYVKRKREEARLSAAALNGDLEAERAADSESPPKYTAPGTDPVAAPTPAVLPTHRIGDDHASVHSTDLPPYTP